MYHLIYTKNWIFLRLLVCFVTISCDDPHTFTKANAKFFFINQTNEIVVITGICAFEEQDSFESASTIQPSDILILSHKDVEVFGAKPSTDNYGPIISQCTMIYGDSSACQFDRRTGFGDIKNYVNRKEVSENNFEFTYLITEQIKAEARECP